MSTETHHDQNTQGHGDFERRDLSAVGIFYFLAGLTAAVVLIYVLLAGFYDLLGRRDKGHQPPVSPLVTNVPANTREIPRTYPQQVFPDPRLETDERTQLDGIRRAEEQKLNSYDWIDQKAGIVRIPIERAMDLVAQRGLPVHPQGTETTAQPKKGR